MAYTVVWPPDGKSMLHTNKPATNSNTPLGLGPDPNTETQLGVLTAAEVYPHCATTHPITGKIGEINKNNSS